MDKNDLGKQLAQTFWRKLVVAMAQGIAKGQNCNNRGVVQEMKIVKWSGLSWGYGDHREENQYYIEYHLQQMRP